MTNSIDSSYASAEETISNLILDENWGECGPEEARDEHISKWEEKATNESLSRVDRSRLYAHIAAHYFLKKDYNNADRCIRQSSRLNQKSPDKRYKQLFLATIQVGLGQHTAAAALAKRLMRMFKNAPEMQLELRMIQLISQNKAHASPNLVKTFTYRHLVPKPASKL